VKESLPIDRDHEWREAWRDRLARGGEDCPSESKLAGLATGEVTGAERTALADHVTACQPCALAYRTLADLHRAAGASRPAPARRLSRILPLVAAAILLALVGFLVVRSGLERGAPSGTDSTLRGSAELSLEPAPAQGAILAEAPTALAWTTVGPSSEELEEEPALWTVEVYDFEMRPLWRSAPLKATATDLPREVRERLAEGSTVYWRVRAGADGPSALFRFRIER
jgi:hypothetical protein